MSRIDGVLGRGFCVACRRKRIKRGDVCAACSEVPRVAGVEPRQWLFSRQVDTMRQIVALTDARGFPPTIREIVRALGLRSPNAGLELVEKLQRKGYVTRTPGLARSTTPTERGWRWAEVAAGG